MGHPSASGHGLKGHGVILLAGGSGRRMGAGINKQLLKLGDQTITEIALRQLIAHGTWDQIVMVAAKGDWDMLATIAKKVTLATGMSIVMAEGGKERQDSVRSGYHCLSDQVKWVWVHDGARPFVDKEMLQRLRAAVEAHGAVIPVLPSKDTLKQVVEEGVVNTLDRSGIYRVQTPQCFDRDLMVRMQEITKAEEGFTDDASVAEALNYKVRTVLGSEWNIKLTTPEDLVVGRCIYDYLKGEGVCV